MKKLLGIVVLGLLLIPTLAMSGTFKDNKWQRMNNEQYPGVGRWCAKVLEEGKIVVGDTVEKISKT